MPLNNSAEIAAFQDGITSPTAFVMDGEEFVMVALPRPWPRDGNTVLCTSPHELDGSGAIIVPMPTKAEVEKWRVFLKDAASKDPTANTTRHIRRWPKSMNGSCSQETKGAQKTISGNSPRSPATWKSSYGASHGAWRHLIMKPGRRRRKTSGSPREAPQPTS